MARKDQITSKVTIPIGIVTLLIGAAIYYFQNISFLVRGVYFNVFFGLLMAFTVCIVASIILILLTMTGYEYKVLPSAYDLRLFYNETVEHYEKHYEDHHKDTGKTKQELINDIFKKKLFELYSESIDHNLGLNNKKLFFQKLTLWSIVFAIIFGTLSLIPFTLANNNYLENANLFGEEVTRVMAEEEKKGGPPPPPPPDNLKLRTISETFSKESNKVNEDDN